MIGDEVYDAWLLSEYHAAADLLTSRGARVVWLTTLCLAERNRGARVSDPERTSRLNAIFTQLDAKRGDELEIFDLHAKVCPEGGFTNQLAGMDDIRPDGAHLSDEAADWVASWLGDRIVASSGAAE